MAMVPPGRREVVAAYDPLTKTIFLPERWTGSSPAELSILVHEMVHYLQSLARLKYECVQASKELAYAAQDKWLRLFGRDLATDFQVDGFTLLASTRCSY
jgi:Zn-dependent membrane protease YugP